MYINAAFHVPLLYISLDAYENVQLVNSAFQNNLSPAMEIALRCNNNLLPVTSEG